MLHNTSVSYNTVNVLIQGRVHKNTAPRVGQKVSELQWVADPNILYFTSEPLASNEIL